MKKRKKGKIAIACQGGGSHAAFTAGVLKRFLQSDVCDRYEIVSLSGTSGGGLCSLLAWYGLVKNQQETAREPYHQLIDFWEDNSANHLWEQYLNYLTVQSCRFYDKGIIPSYISNPYTWGGVQEFWQSVTPRREYLDLKKLLEKHINFSQLPRLINSSSPRLFLGAVNVISGESKIFDSRQNEIEIDAILASAAIPTLFKAVEIGDAAYWDSLFAENPPILSLVDEQIIPPEQWPDELWVIQVNPRACDSIPRTTPEILDRRNQLSGNLSLYQSLELIEKTNRWLQKGFLNGDLAGISPVQVRQLEIKRSHLEGLDYASKFDRHPSLINHLISVGFAQADSFVEPLLNARDLEDILYPESRVNINSDIPESDPAILWQIGTSSKRLKVSPQGVWTPEYNYYIGSDADPIKYPSLPTIITAPDAEKPPGVASTDCLNIHFRLYRDYQEGELTLSYHRDGLGEDWLFLDGILLIRIWGAGENQKRQTELQLGSLSEGEHTITLTTAKGKGKHRIYEFKLAAGVSSATVSETPVSLGGETSQKTVTSQPLLAELPDSLDGLNFAVTTSEDRSKLCLEVTNSYLNADVLDFRVVAAEVISSPGESVQVLEEGEFLSLGNLPAKDSEPSKLTGEIILDAEDEPAKIETVKIQYSGRVSVSGRGRDHLKLMVNKGDH
ncbi:patatin-like phospholipase family protein [Limnospira platensis]|uniref:patatin-like phospholipase family protein n=1 Tax=Limnospira platensis TaxID=118562 RepID=UPI000280410F|nr:patatin [Arthrospira platensis C1]UWU51035.1 NTE family protein [Arthrospira platensis C1]